MQQADIIGIIGAVVGILGVATSYYFYRRSIRIKEPCWAVRSHNLIQGYRAQLDHLRVLYKNKNVENLTVSRVLFCNYGADTIDRLHIVTANPLRIVPLNKNKLLDAKILASNNSANQFAIDLADDGDCAFLDFDYLDQKQGAVIQIVHNGTSSEDIQVIGDIKGAHGLRHIPLVPKWVTTARRLLARTGYASRLSRSFSNLSSYFALGTGMLYILLGTLGTILLLMPPLSPTLSSPESMSKAAPAPGLIVLLLVSGIILFIVGRSTRRRSGFAPRGLEIFDKDW